MQDVGDRDPGERAHDAAADAADPSMPPTPADAHAADPFRGPPGLRRIAGPWARPAADLNLICPGKGIKGLTPQAAADPLKNIKYTVMK